MDSLCVYSMCLLCVCVYMYVQYVCMYLQYVCITLSPTYEGVMSLSPRYQGEGAVNREPHEVRLVPLTTAEG